MMVETFTYLENRRLARNIHPMKESIVAQYYFGCYISQHLFILVAILFIQVDTLLDSIKWDDKGLAVAIAQNVDTGAILMQGFINRDALATTTSSRKATFFSRSRATLWTKGETSDNFINIHDIFVDCDRDSII